MFSFILVIFTNRHKSQSLPPRMKGIDMKTFKSVISWSVLFFLLSINPVLGANWVEYGQSNKGDVYSYNKSSVKNISGDIKEVWERIDFSKENVRNGIKSTVFKREMDCQESKSRILSVLNYDVFSTMLHSNLSDQSDWKDIPPDTRLATLKKILCE
jgi:hypothetical protein